MIVLFAVLGYLALGGVLWLLYYRLTKAKEALVAARLQVAQGNLSKDAARKAVRAAEARCMQAMRDLEASLATAGQAMEVAGHIQVVSQQLHGLIEYVAGPPEAAGAQGAGRHALPGGEYLQAITSGTQEMQEMQEAEEYIP